MEGFQHYAENPSFDEIKVGHLQIVVKDNIKMIATNIMEYINRQVIILYLPKSIFHN